MECTYCESELTYEGPYGKGNLAAQEKYGYGWEKHGDIYRCPNSDGFNSKEEADAYLKEIGETLNSLGLESWEELVCDSATHNVSGSFYTNNDNLKEGYPC